MDVLWKAANAFVRLRRKDGDMLLINIISPRSVYVSVGVGE